jgi:RNA polymerase sigma factor (TIGR02999 family)
MTQQAVFANEVARGSRSLPRRLFALRCAPIHRKPCRHQKTNPSASRCPGCLADWSKDDPAARDALVAIVYKELRRLAHHYLQGERANHTLQTTALVNEAYLRLTDLTRMQWRDRSHFFAMAATLMRRILVDHARDRARDKRGGGVVFTALQDEQVAAPSRIEALALDEALDRLTAIDPLHARIVELRYFAGLTIEETSEALRISPATVKREWTWARAWLYHQLGGP